MPSGQRNSPDEKLLGAGQPGRLCLGYRCGDVLGCGLGAFAAELARGRGYTVELEAVKDLSF